ncbi:MAG: MFS transporter [Pseudomonadota bacterium]
MKLLDRYPALKFPLYRRYWLASLGSVGGWQLASLAMGWLVFELTKSTLDLGILGAAIAIPAIALTIVGGVVADRFEKRSILLITTLINSFLLFLLGVLDWTGVITVWQVWLIAGAISLVSGFDWPTRRPSFPILLIAKACFQLSPLTRSYGRSHAWCYRPRAV